MMHAPKLKNSALTLLCSPQSLFACVIYGGEKPHLYSLKKIPLTKLEFEHLIVFNPTRIQNMIAPMGAQELPLYIGLVGPTIKNKCVDLATAQPTFAQLPISHAPHWQWDYCYLYPYENRYYFYLCGIPKELILQFQLLALRNNFNIAYLSSERMALLQLYKKMFGTAYRPAQLGIHMQQIHNNIDALFTRDDLSRMLTIPPHLNVEPDDMSSLLACCGLYIAGESYA